MGFRFNGSVLTGYAEEPGVTDVVIPKGVTRIGNNAFEGCESLTSVTIPEGVTSIDGWAFCGCKSLTSVTLPESVISIGACAFRFCESLASITIPVSVTSIGWGAFNGCTSLTSVTLPEGLTGIGEWGIFSGCKSLTSITIPQSVTSVGNQMFYGCEGLADASGLVVVNGTVYWCRRDVTSVTVPEGVTRIDDEAFEDCYKMVSIEIPTSVTSIGSRVLKGCKNLRSVTCPSAIAKELSDALPNTQRLITLHIDDITGVSMKFRPGAAAGFAEDGRSCTDENGKKYCKYIKANAVRLLPMAMEHPALFYLMLREKLIAAKDLEAVTAAVQESGNAEWIAAMLEYGHSSVSEKDKQKVRQRQDERETNLTNFVFDAEKLEALRGRTFVVTGKLKTFVSRDELKECLAACGAVLTETLARGVDYLITNTPDSGTAKNKKAVELGIDRITEAQFNEMIGRNAQE